MRIIKELVALTIILAIVALGLGRTAYNVAAHAEEPEPTPTPEQTVLIVIEAEPTPVPDKAHRPQTVIYDYQIGQWFIEAVARGMYGLDTAAEKLAFAFIVINRLFCYATRKDGAYVFARDIYGIVTQAGEFAFYNPDAPLTEENLELAELGLNAQMTFHMTKEYTGYIFPTNLLYMEWINGELYCLPEIGGEPWKVG